MRSIRCSRVTCARVIAVTLTFAIPVLAGCFTESPLGPSRESTAFFGQGEICPSDFAVSFDGVDGRIDLNAEALGSPADVTVETWVRLDETGKLHVLVSDAHDDFNNGFTLMVNGHTQAAFAVAAFIGRQGVATGSTVLEVGRWYHLAGTYDYEAAAVKVFVNGEEDGSAAYNGGIAYPLGRDLRFGMQVKAFRQTDRFLLGALDEVRIWKSARTAEEIAASAAGEGLEGVPPDLIGYWPMSEGQGTSTADASSSGNRGTLLGGASWEGTSRASCTELPIEIKPDLSATDRPKPININQGTTPVAVYSTPELDVSQELDWMSLTFGRTGDEPSLSLNGQGEPQCAAVDLNHDGRSDLICHFITAAMELQMGDLEAYLKGTTLQGERVAGRDSVRVIHWVLVAW